MAPALREPMATTVFGMSIDDGCGHLGYNDEDNSERHRDGGGNTKGGTTRSSSVPPLRRRKSSGTIKGNNGSGGVSYEFDDDDSAADIVTPRKLTGFKYLQDRSPVANAPIGGKKEAKKPTSSSSSVATSSLDDIFGSIHGTNKHLPSQTSNGRMSSGISRSSSIGTEKTAPLSPFRSNQNTASLSNSSNHSSHYACTSPGKLRERCKTREGDTLRVSLRVSSHSPSQLRPSRGAAGLMASKSKKSQFMIDSTASHHGREGDPKQQWKKSDGPPVVASSNDEKDKNEGHGRGRGRMNEISNHDTMALQDNTFPSKSTHSSSSSKKGRSRSEEPKRRRGRSEEPKGLRNRVNASDRKNRATGEGRGAIEDPTKPRSTKSTSFKDSNKDGSTTDNEKTKSRGRSASLGKYNKMVQKHKQQRQQPEKEQEENVIRKGDTSRGQKRQQRREEAKQNSEVIQMDDNENIIHQAGGWKEEEVLHEIPLRGDDGTPVGGKSFQDGSIVTAPDSRIDNHDDHSMRSRSSSTTPSVLDDDDDGSQEGNEIFQDDDEDDADEFHHDNASNVGVTSLSALNDDIDSISRHLLTNNVNEDQTYLTTNKVAELQEGKARPEQERFLGTKPAAKEILSSSNHSGQQQLQEKKARPKQEELSRSSSHSRRKRQQKEEVRPEQEDLSSKSSHSRQQRQQKEEMRPKQKELSSSSSHSRRQRQQKEEVRPEQEDLSSKSSHGRRQRQQKEEVRPEQEDLSSKSSHGRWQRQQKEDMRPEQEDLSRKSSHGRWQRQQKEAVRPEQEALSRKSSHGRRQRGKKEEVRPEQEELSSSSSHSRRQQHQDKKARPKQDELSSSSSHSRQQRRQKEEVRPEQGELSSSSSHRRRQPSRSSSEVRPEQGELSSSSSHRRWQPSRSSSEVRPEQEELSSRSSHSRRQPIRSSSHQGMENDGTVEMLTGRRRGTANVTADSPPSIGNSSPRRYAGFSPVSRRIPTITSPTNDGKSDGPTNSPGHERHDATAHNEGNNRIKNYNRTMTPTRLLSRKFSSTIKKIVPLPLRGEQGEINDDGRGGGTSDEIVDENAAKVDAWKSRIRSRWTEMSEQRKDSLNFDDEDNAVTNSMATAPLSFDCDLRVSSKGDDVILNARDREAGTLSSKPMRRSKSFNEGLSSAKEAVRARGKSDYNQMLLADVSGGDACRGTKNDDLDAKGIERCQRKMTKCKSLDVNELGFGSNHGKETEHSESNKDQKEKVSKLGMKKGTFLQEQKQESVSCINTDDLTLTSAKQEIKRIEKDLALRQQQRSAKRQPRSLQEPTKLAAWQIKQEQTRHVPPAMHGLYNRRLDEDDDEVKSWVPPAFRNSSKATARQNARGAQMADGKYVNKEERQKIRDEIDAYRRSTNASEDHATEKDETAGLLHHQGEKLEGE